MKNLRMKKRLSLNDVSNILGNERKTLSSMENGTTRIKIDDLVALAYLYETSINYLINGENELYERLG